MKNLDILLELNIIERLLINSEMNRMGKISDKDYIQYLSELNENFYKKSTDLNKMMGLDKGE